MTTLDQLRGMGAFAPEKPIQKTIKFTIKGEELSAEIWVKAISVEDQERVFGNGKPNKSQSALIVSEFVTLGSDGTERISYDDALGLRHQVRDAMRDAVAEENWVAPEKN